MVAAVQLELNKVLCTEKLCSWKKYRKRAHPAPLKYINFKRPRQTKNFPQVDEPFKGTLQGFSNPDPVKFCTEEFRGTLENLKAIAPDAAVFTSISMWSDDDCEEKSDTDSADETRENSLPEPLTSLFDPSIINECPSNVLQTGLDRYNIYTSGNFQKQYENLTNVTKIQRNNETWYLHRAGRITASISKVASNVKIEKPSPSFLNTVMQYSKPIDVAATRYGNKTEHVARKEYMQLVHKSHKNLTLSLTGLHIDEENPCLGASPDGIIQCDCHDRGVLEIKCPFKHKNGLAQWRADKNCPIDLNGNMKENHAYYYQIQHQMMVTDTSYCDFFVYSKGKQDTDIFLIRVKKNQQFCDSLKGKLIKIFQNVILPEILTRKNDPNNKLDDKLYCVCKRPAFNPMIACDNINCNIEWFHYTCMNVTRAPAKKWYCPKCKKM